MQTGSTDRVRRVRQRVLTSIVVIYTVLVVGAWMALWWADAWWPATLLMFAPRWIIALPFVVLAPLTYVLQSRTSALLLVLAFVISVPAVGFNIPWKRLLSPSAAGTPFRVMTLNMHYCTSDSKALEALIHEVSADVIAIQEWSGAKDASILQDAKWHIQKNDRLFLASRYPIKKTTELGRDSMGENASMGHYEIETPFGIMNVFSLHTATIRQGIYDTIHEKSKGPEELKENSSLRLEQSQFMAEQAKRCQGPVLLMGDFNTPRESIIFRKVWHNYQDAFTVAGWGLGYTFIGAHTSVRIDHVLLGQGWNCSSCRVGPYVGSPHRAVIADLHWKGQD